MYRSVYTRLTFLPAVFYWAQDEGVAIVVDACSDGISDGVEEDDACAYHTPRSVVSSPVEEFSSDVEVTSSVDLFNSRPIANVVNLVDSHQCHRTTPVTLAHGSTGNAPFELPSLSYLEDDGTVTGLSVKSANPTVSENPVALTEERGTVPEASDTSGSSVAGGPSLPHAVR